MTAQWLGGRGAGAVLSAGLFRRAAYSDVENKIANQYVPAFCLLDCTSDRSYRHVQCPTRTCRCKP